MAFDIKFIFLPQLIYFLFTLMRRKQKLSRMDLCVYLGLPMALIVSAILAYSIAGNGDMAGVYIPFGLALMAGICLVSGVAFILLNWALRKIRREEVSNG
ncbi:hypothetical protein [Chromobacterium vaccinii]|uniref:hypothetical protein n=1 Tax=Chromobacterium vaccinii TaxID=1108595 RepID=UPI000E1788EC|nr:hypothetical protein [Chromobacterium vaccinii]SUX30512.1 Uncharacterised protein [Chromobacterium vaccinii]